MANVKNPEVEEQWKYFKVYCYLPLLLACLILFFYFVWGIIDANNASQAYSWSDATYGTMKLSSGFLCWFVWMLIGGVNATIVYFIAKIFISQKILTVLYLQSLDNKSPAQLSEKSSDEKSSQIDDNLTYTLNKDHESYSVVRISSTYLNKQTIEIASSCNNKPVTKIGASAFSGCKAENIIIPNTITHIDDNAFRNCENIKNITIPNSVLSIGISAFSGCSNLTTLTIPNSVKEIHDYAFDCCYGITNVTMPAFAISCVPHKHLKNVTISNGDIPAGAFSECENLENVIIDKGVTSIGNSAFAGCDKLTTATFKNVNGWSCDGENISVEELSNEKTAATFLTETYVDNDLERNLSIIKH